MENLKNEINSRLDESEIILSRVSNIANNIEEILLSSKISFIQKLKLKKDTKELLSTFEIEFKYIPQIYFETLKLVRYCWYNYEANIAIDSIS